MQVHNASKAGPELQDAGFGRGPLDQRLPSS